MSRAGVQKTRWRCLRLLSLLGLLSVPLAAERIEIEIPVGTTEGGQAISAEDVTVEVAGRAAEVLSIRDGRPSSRVVIYVDDLLSPPLSVHNGLLELAEQASSLVGLGTVEVVSAGEEVRRSVPPTRAPEQLAEALAWLRLRTKSEGGQLVVRERFVEEARLADLVGNEHLAISATGGQRLAEIASLVREALAEEAELLGRHRNQLLAWAAEQASSEPKMLLLVGGGFDLDLEQFYREILRPFELAELVDDQVTPEIAPTINDLARTLSAVGWTIWSYSPEAAQDALLEGGEEKGPAEVTTTYEGGRRVDRTVITPRFDALEGLRRLLGGSGKSVPEAALLEPHEGLRELTRETGGSVLVDRAQLESAFDVLSRRLVVTAELPVEIADLVAAQAAVRPSSGDADRALGRRWVSPGMPELLSVVRAQQLLDGDSAEGGLFVEAIAEEAADSGSLRLEVITARNVEESEGLPFERLQVTTVAFEADGRLSSERRELRGAQISDGAFSVDLGSTVSPDSPVVVIVEDLQSGQWGGAYASLVAASGFDVLGSLGGLLPAPRAVHLLAPREPLAIGKVRIETVLSDRVSKVEFYLDGQLETVRKSLPFSVPVTLGKYPDRHSVEAVAYDSGGLEIGRDRLILNAGTGTFRVRIVSPEDPGEPGSLLTGPVVVRAAVEMPRGSEINRVQFYWNNELFATRFAPPFVQRFPIPADGPSGFFRVEALLADGSRTEDVLFINSPGGSERVRVELVELFTVVTDRQGHPVTSLPAEAFRVFEDGVEQEVATFSEAGDLPLTVGLAIDSSASMFVKLPDVQKAAAKFVNELQSTEDRAFVVRFGGGPQLVRDTTMDLSGVEKALYTLEPDGRTEIWKGIVYSLVQLQSVPGKKALIVFSDGADEDPDFSYRTCLRFARRVGVPVYVIVSNDEIYRTEGKGLTIRGFMNRLQELVRSVGGRVFVTRVGGDLSAIYGKIDEELRSQYLLGYYARDAGGERFRELNVDVDGTGLRARTIAGYYR
ncbi:MAG: VWA domain-containing protein [bacterium]|nr:VWA domain-containing protein [bacterium]